jgi:hypothetical protein
MQEIINFIEKEIAYLQNEEDKWEVADNASMTAITNAQITILMLVLRKARALNG